MKSETVKMIVSKRVPRLFLFAIFFLFILFLTSRWFATVDFCENVVQEKLTSPFETNVATIVGRGCGATTSQMTLLILRPKPQEFKDEEALFDEKWDDVVMLIEKDVPIQIEWQTDEQLIITLPPSSIVSKNDIARKHSRWKNIKISYKRAKK